MKNVPTKRRGLPGDALGEIAEVVKEPRAGDRTALERCTEYGYDEGLAIRDGAIVIYNLDSPPSWLPGDPECES